MYVFVFVYIIVIKFFLDKDIYKIDRYWLLVCYRFIFKVYLKCIYVIILYII